MQKEYETIFEKINNDSIPLKEILDIIAIIWKNNQKRIEKYYERTLKELLDKSMKNAWKYLKTIKYKETDKI